MESIGPDQAWQLQGGDVAIVTGSATDDSWTCHRVGQDGGVRVEAVAASEFQGRLKGNQVFRLQRRLLASAVAALESI